MTKDFTPALQFQLGDQWEGYLHSADAVGIRERSSGRVLTEIMVAKLQAVFDPICINEETISHTGLLGTEPADVIRWVQAQTILETSDVSAVNYAGRSGLQIEASIKGPFEVACPGGIGNRVHLFSVGEDSVWIRNGQRVQITALDVDGSTVTIVAGAPANAFRRVLADDLDPVVRSITFGTD